MEQLNQPVQVHTRNNEDHEAPMCAAKLFLSLDATILDKEAIHQMLLFLQDSAYSLAPAPAPLVTAP
mgnify:CR=1 FL=1